MRGPARAFCSAVAAVSLATAAIAIGAPGAGAATKPTGPPIKLMVVFEKSVGIGNPDTADGAIAAAKAINKAGGLGGRPVQVEVCDTANDPNTAAACGTQAVSDGVVAMVGNLTTYSEQFMPLLVQNKIPSIGLNPAGAADFTSAAAFPITGGAVVTFGTLPLALANRVPRRSGWSGPTSQRAGAQDVRQQHAEERQPDDRERRTGPNGRAGHVDLRRGRDRQRCRRCRRGPGRSGRAELRDRRARQTDPNLKMALISTDVVKVTKTLGKSAEGIIETAAFFSAKQAKAANKAYDTAMKAAGFKKGSSELSYSAVQVFAAVAKDLPDITAAVVYDKLPTVSGLSIGLLPPLQFQTGGVGGIPRIFNGCEQSTQLKNKKLVPLTPMQNPFTGSQPCPTSLTAASPRTAGRGSVGGPAKAWAIGIHSAARGPVTSRAVSADVAALRDDEAEVDGGTADDVGRRVTPRPLGAVRCGELDAHVTGGERPPACRIGVRARAHAEVRDVTQPGRGHRSIASRRAMSCRGPTSP